MRFNQKLFQSDGITLLGQGVEEAGKRALKKMLDKVGGAGGLIIIDRLSLKLYVRCL